MSGADAVGRLIAEAAARLAAERNAPRPLAQALAAETEHVRAAAAEHFAYARARHLAGDTIMRATFIEPDGSPGLGFTLCGDTPGGAARALREWASEQAHPTATLVACYSSTHSGDPELALTLRCECWARGARAWLAHVEPDGSVRDEWQAARCSDFLIGERPGVLAS